MGGATIEEVIEALLAEGSTTLLQEVDRASIEPFDEANDERAPQRAWEKELARFREEAEIRCEAAFANQVRANTQLARCSTESGGPESRETSAHSEETSGPDWGDGAVDLDRELRRISAELAQREFLLGERAEVFWRADGWRRLRYATESQYARERLGLGPGQMSALGGKESQTGEEPQGAREYRALGKVTLRFRVEPGTLRLYRWLERLFLRHGPRQGSFLRFLCVALIDAWKHTLGSDEAYAHVYARDGFRCTNPVCSRRDVTPHHLQFRSAGGDDSDENLTSLCVQCHLEGVHGGRLAVRPPASAMERRIGRNAHTIVKGRRRWRARDRATSELPHESSMGSATSCKTEDRR
jgi:hypothetical protein